MGKKHTCNVRTLLLEIVDESDRKESYVSFKSLFKILVKIIGRNCNKSLFYSEKCTQIFCIPYLHVHFTSINIQDDKSKTKGTNAKQVFIILNDVYNDLFSVKIDDSSVENLRTLYNI